MPISIKTLRIALENVDFRLPTQVTDDNSVLALKSLAFEPLVKWRPHGAFEPALFASWTASSDARLWTFHIRDNATFHDGVPCTARVIVDYIKGFLDSTDYFGMKWSYARYFAETDFFAIDDRTVQVRSAAPFGDLPQIFNDFWPCRIDAEGKPIIGTGPYRVKEFERREGRGRAILELTDSDVKPTLASTILAIHEPEASKRLDLVRTNQVDLALNLERIEALAELDFLPPPRWGRVSSTLSVIYYLNNFTGLFSNPSARLAANLAIDKVQLVKEVYHNLATPACTAVSPPHLGFREANLAPIPHDPALARSLLSTLRGSQPSLFPATLILRTPTYMPEHAIKISHFVASALEDAGFPPVEVQVETDRPQYARSIGLEKNLGDVALFDSTPNTTFRVLDDKISETQSAEKTWWMGYRDEEFEKLFDKVKRQGMRDEQSNQDESEWRKSRAQAYAKCLTRLKDNPPWIYVAHPDAIWAMAEGVDVDVGPSGVLEIK